MFSSLIRKKKHSIILVGMLTLLASSIMAEEKPRIITVNGKGTETVPTTIASVQLGVQVKGEKATEVHAEVAKYTNAVVALLQKYKVERMQTKGVNLQPQYDYTDKRQRLVGYLGANTISFRTSIDKAGTILDEAVKVGATRIDSVSFLADDNALQAAQEKALVRATEDAQRTANVVLKALQYTALEVVSIRVDEMPQPFPMFQNALGSSGMDGAAPTPIMGGEQTVEMGVTLEIRY